MPKLDLSLIAHELDSSERHFITREYGAKIYPFLRDCLASTAEEEALVLTFPPNQLLDVSFADETIIRLGKELLEDKYGQKGILLKGMTPDSIENTEAAIHYQRLHLAFLSLLSDEKWGIIGQVETALASTLNIVNIHGQLTAPELASQLNIAINTASNRLKRLFDLHLVRRQHTISESGLTYIYSFWRWNV
jgi:hypothetical protein